ARPRDRRRARGAGSAAAAGPPASGGGRRRQSPGSTARPRAPRRCPRAAARSGPARGAGAASRGRGGRRRAGRSARCRPGPGPRPPRNASFDVSICMGRMLKIRTDERPTLQAPGPLVMLLTRRVTFAAAHVLRRDDWDDDLNEAVFGMCARDHGHNYVLEVSVSGEPDPDTGMVLNLRDLDRVVRDAIVEHADHRHLNHAVPFLVGVVPTAENVALAFWDRLEDRLLEPGAGVQLRRLRLVESENNTVEISR